MYFEHDGLSFYFTESGQGVPFIFLHGLGGSAEQIMSIYSPPSGIRLIAFDFRGHGKTLMGSKDHLNFKSFADDTLAILNHLEINAAIVGGISMGAAVALNFAIRYPAFVLGLILSRPAWLDGPMEKKNNLMFKTIARLIREHGPEAGRQVFETSDLYKELSDVSPSTAQSLRGHFNYERALETAVKFERIPDDAPGYNREEWKRLTAPTLVIANKSDPVHPYEYGLEYASGIAGADFREVTPKSVSEEQHKTDVQKAIDAFIANVLNRTKVK